MSSDNVTPTHKVSDTVTGVGVLAGRIGVFLVWRSLQLSWGEKTERGLNSWKLPATCGKELDSSKITLDLVFKPHLLAQCPDVSVDCFRDGPWNWTGVCTTPYWELHEGPQAPRLRKWEVDLFSIGNVIVHKNTEGRAQPCESPGWGWRRWQHSVTLRAGSMWEGTREEGGVGRRTFETVFISSCATIFPQIPKLKTLKARNGMDALKICDGTGFAVNVSSFLIFKSFSRCIYFLIKIINFSDPQGLPVCVHVSPTPVSECCNWD